MRMFIQKSDDPAIVALLPILYFLKKRIPMQFGPQCELTVQPARV